MAAEEAAGANDVATVTPEEIAAKAAVEADTTDNILTTAMAIITEETTETTSPLMGVNFRVEGMLVVAAV